MIEIGGYYGEMEFGVKSALRLLETNKMSKDNFHRCYKCRQVKTRAELMIRDRKHKIFICRPCNRKNCKNFYHSNKEKHNLNNLKSLAKKLGYNITKIPTSEI